MFHQLEASSRARSTTAPPAPPVRHPLNQPPAVKRPGLRVTDAHYVPDLCPPKPSRHHRSDAPNRRPSLPGYPDTDHQRAPQSTHKANAKNRRLLKRHLTVDSANQFVDNERSLNSSSNHALQLWTSTIMAEFQQIIDTEIERLSKENRGIKPDLSPWAKKQIAVIEDRRSVDWSNDIELVEKQIYDDIVTLSLNQSSSGDSGAPSGQESNDSTVPDEVAEEEAVQLASPVLVSLHFFYL